PRESVLQPQAGRGRPDEGPLPGAARPQGLPGQLGVRLPLVLAHRAAALRVGRALPHAARRAADRLRVHDREFFLVRDPGRVPRPLVLVGRAKPVLLDSEYIGDEVLLISQESANQAPVKEISMLMSRPSRFVLLTVMLLASSSALAEESKLGFV